MTVAAVGVEGDDYLGHEFGDVGEQLLLDLEQVLVHEGAEVVEADLDGEARVVVVEEDRRLDTEGAAGVLEFLLAQLAPGRSLGDRRVDVGMDDLSFLAASGADQVDVVTLGRSSRQGAAATHGLVVGMCENRN